MIDCGNAVAETLLLLERDGVCGVVLQSFKRDRSVRVLRLGPDRFAVEEDGFRVERTETDPRALRGLLKRLVRREFPRSNRLHVRLERGA